MSEPVRIKYVDDYGPLGIRRFPADRYPREYDTYEMGPVGSITLPRSMTQKEWEFLFLWVELTRDSGRVIDDAAPLRSVAPVERDAQPVADATDLDSGAAS